MANALVEHFKSHRSIVRDYFFEGNKNNHTADEATASLHELSVYCMFIESLSPQQYRKLERLVENKEG